MDSSPRAGLSLSACAIAAQRCCPSLMTNSACSKSISRNPSPSALSRSNRISHLYEAVIEEKRYPSSLSRMYQITASLDRGKSGLQTSGRDSLCRRSMPFSHFRTHGHNGTVQQKHNMKRCRLRVPSPPEVMAAGLVMFYFSFNLSADPLDQCTRRNLLPTAGRLEAVTYGNANFVAVGLRGAVAVSTNGTNWVSQNSGTSENLHGVACGKGIFVAVGDYGLILSSDGSSW